MLVSFALAAAAIMLFNLSLIHIIDGAVLLSFIIALYTIRGYRRRRGLPYPPGPPGLPLIGNFFDIPSTFPWLAYTDYSKKYGMHFIHQWVFLFFLRLGGRVHHILPLSPQRLRRLEQYQCYQRPLRKTRGCLLRSCRYAIPRDVRLVW